MKFKKRVSRLEGKIDFYDELIIKLAKNDSIGEKVDSVLDEFEVKASKREVDVIKDTRKRITVLSLLSCLLAVVGMLFSFRQSR